VAVVAAGAGAGAAVGLSGSSSGNSASSGVGSGGSGSDPFGGGSGSGSGSTGGSGSGGSLNTQSLSNKVDPGLVDVTSQLKYEQATAEGTGMVMTSSGLVLTNNHVIDEATSITATLVESGKTYTAKVVGYDSTDDVTVLQLVGASGLKTVSFGDSSTVKEGDSVLALGNAGGRGGLPSAAQGTIDGIGQTIQASDAGANDTETLHNMLETDAPIEEGDSGGPLVNASGQVIGMDTAANSSSSSGGGDGSGDGSGGTGIPGDGGSDGGTGSSGTGGEGSSDGSEGFAIPINTAQSIAKQIESGKATSTVHIGLAGFMGISVSDPSQGCGSDSGSGSGSGSGSSGSGSGSSGSGSGSSGSGGESGGTAPTSSGALVCSTISGTPAASSGLVAGDVITSVDGHSVTSEASLTNLTATSHPGDELTVGYVAADGSKHTAKFALAEWAK
jgi:S1-C subfamily serine protease